MDRDSFLRAALVPRDSSHAAGGLDDANEILAAHPSLTQESIYTAASVGDDVTVRAFLERDPSLSTSRGGPYDWDALTHLCFSRYLRDETRSASFVRAADALLAAGASANTGFTERDGQWESVLYGAAGIAHHAPLTELLLRHGADPTDVEVLYHTPESYDNAALQLIVHTGKLSEQDLVLMLLRKHDWHDHDGAKWLLEHGANPNLVWRNGSTALQHALRRDNDIRMIALLLDYGADAAAAVRQASWQGRKDVLELFDRRGVNTRLDGLDAVVQRTARGVPSEEHPDLIRHGGELLRNFAGTGNVDGVRALLDLGVPVDTPVATDDGYWGIAENSTALHVAAWRLRHDVVKLLIERGANVNVRDGKGRTPLQLVRRASTDSYWTELASPASVEALSAAGAS